MELAISTGLYYTKTHSEILDIIAASGCKNIELFLNQAFIDLSVDEIKEAIDARGLRVTSIHLPLTFIAYERGETEEYWIQKGLHYLDRLGGQVLVSHFFYQADNKKLNNDTSHFNNIETYSLQSKIHLCTENLPITTVNTLLSDKEVLSTMLEQKNLVMTFDTTHAASFEDDFFSHYGAYKPYIRNIHLSDYKDGQEHKVLGSGDLPIKEFLTLLKEDHYNGLMTLEYDFENQERNNITDDQHAIELLKASLDYVKRVIE